MIHTPSIPRIVIAGTHSGCGKTTVARGVMEAMSRRGYTVQPFKVGPDFIDPTHHSAICGRVSRNLDAFMMGENGVTETFIRASAGADIAVIEGVMGMYDGVDGGDVASTAHVMRILSAPALLVADARGMSRSVHALVKGFVEFEPGIKIGGVVFNRVGSPRHRELIECGRTIPAVGYLPRTADLEIESRHLGLAMAHETAPATGLGELMEEHCDIDQVIRIAGEAPPLTASNTGQHKGSVRARIGVAMDEAFCFYYQDNLDLLERSGARIVSFSPARDEFPEVDAVYIGGGYPELHAAALESSPCRNKIIQAASDGMPVYAECGGLLYVCESLETNRTYRMAGLLPANARMTDRVQALGYSEGAWSGGPALAPSRGRIIGHEFHYSEVECRQDARFSITLARGRGIANGKDGLFAGESLAAYMHAYFSPSFAVSFVNAASAYCRT
ncbi:MAG TPA: hydrogenobyrinic acid a,c-diamide synthase (glutamine-hydrolyzing) [Methanolinea sp.]|nr:hydrogenobyrinic acid a,c-diamide synthase (glutamine-hydrolyzing) [Methanolinea sp.]HQK56697.1 hydrogenobyrinic acid a,c-diamide synthase (glutamine-hydrolyzing) [Methanolinea sp.]